MKYAEELTKAMTWLGQMPDTIFIGQAVMFPGTAMSNTLSGVPEQRKIELPVTEEMQMGITNGLALNGIVPISLFPRWNFLLLAANQLVNHTDKLRDLGWNSKAIIRVGIGSKSPMHPGVQHIGDYTEEFSCMCLNMDVVRLNNPEDIVPAYQQAYSNKRPTILVEYGDHYNDK